MNNFKKHYRVITTQTYDEKIRSFIVNELQSLYTLTDIVKYKEQIESRKHGLSMLLTNFDIYMEILEGKHKFQASKPTKKTEYSYKDAIDTIIKRRINKRSR